MASCCYILYKSKTETTIFDQLHMERLIYIKPREILPDFGSFRPASREVFSASPATRLSKGWVRWRSRAE